MLRYSADIKTEPCRRCR